MNHAYGILVAVITATSLLLGACGQKAFDRRSYGRAVEADARPSTEAAEPEGPAERPKKDKTKSPRDEGRPPGEEGVYASGKELYDRHCAVCHGELAASTKRNKTSEEIAASIQTVGVMKFLGTMTPAELDAVALALSDAAREEFEPAGGPVVGLAPGTRTYFLPTRSFVASQLSAVFSTAANPLSTTLIDRYVTSQAAAFGGACRPYDGKCATTNTPDRLANQDAAMQPQASPVRAGLRIQICEKILEQQVHVSNALTNAGLTTDAAVTRVSAKQLIGLFTPGHPVGDVEADQLVAIATQGKASGFGGVDQWRFVMLPLCTSSNFDQI